MHFPEFFISLIQKCISISQIAIRFNQQITSYFKTTRGLSQGDSLSPLLFIISMQAFSTLIESGIEDNGNKSLSATMV